MRIDEYSKSGTLHEMNMAAAVPGRRAHHQECAAIGDDHVAYCSRAHPSRK